MIESVCCQDDSSSRDGREPDDQASSVGDDEGGPYEELLTAVAYAKDGDRSISDIFKVLPAREVGLHLPQNMPKFSSNGIYLCFHSTFIVSPA